MPQGHFTIIIFKHVFVFFGQIIHLLIITESLDHNQSMWVSDVPILMVYIVSKNTFNISSVIHFNTHSIISADVMRKTVNNWEINIYSGSIQ